MEEKNSYLSADPETIRQIDEKMPPEEELQDLAEFFKVFGDATRLKILSVLLCSEMCVRAMTQRLESGSSRTCWAKRKQK